MDTLKIRVGERVGVLLGGHGLGGRGRGLARRLGLEPLEDLAEQSVDERRAFLGAERLGEFDGLVDGDLGGRAPAGHLEVGEAEDGAVDGREPAGGPFRGEGIELAVRRGPGGESVLGELEGPAFVTLVEGLLGETKSRPSSSCMVSSVLWSTVSERALRIWARSSSGRASNW